jgi:heme/copper-type cytochrome/quinol oxidase subunit 1
VRDAAARDAGLHARASTLQSHQTTGRWFLLFAIAALIIQGILIILVRAELADPGQQIFANAELVPLLVTSSGLIVTFFVLIPALLGGFGHLLVPPMIGAEHSAFPTLARAGFLLLPLGFGIFLFALFGKADGASLPLAGTALSLAGLSATAVISSP